MLSDERDLVLRARNDDRAAFERLMIRYQRRAFGLARGILRSEEDVQEAVQESFLRAFLGLRNLKKPESFGSWFYQICRTTAFRHARKAGAERSLAMASMEDFPESVRQRAEWEDFPEILRLSIGLLRPGLKEVVQLRYFAGLSAGETAALCGISPSLVKSRLHEAREKLRQILPTLHEGVAVTPQQSRITKEALMRNLDFTRNGARVLERLSLHQQVRLCTFVQKKEKFDESLLEEIGRVDVGRDFINGCKATLDFAELSRILNYADPMTELRIVSELEKADPDLAETVKQNTFIFEDVTLLDVKAIRALVDRVPRNDLLIALSSTMPEVKAHILSAFDEAGRTELIRQAQSLDSGAAEVARARFTVVDACRAMNDEGAMTGSRDVAGRWSFTVRG
jgi:RNA polymerase sigma-70 factor, ECF subfamily